MTFMKSRCHTKSALHFWTLLSGQIWNVSGNKQLIHNAHNKNFKISKPLPAMIAILAAQSSAQTFIDHAILYTDTSNNAWYNQSGHHIFR